MLTPDELRAIQARVAPLDGAVPVVRSQAGAGGGHSGGPTPSKTAGPGTIQALTQLVPRTFELHVGIRDLVQPVSESTVSELDSDGNVHSKLKKFGQLLCPCFSS